MKRNAKRMGTGRILAALLMALMATVAPPSGVSSADIAGGGAPAARAAGSVWEESGSGEDAGIQRWWGVAGAVICGAEIRLIRLAPAIGLNPYVLAAGIAGCALAALDIITTQ